MAIAHPTPQSPEELGLGDDFGLSPLVQMRNRALHHPGFLFGALVTLAVMVIAAGAPLFAPHDPYMQDLSARLRPPVWSGGEWSHPFGTDQLGRDLLSRLIFGARISLGVGLAAAFIAGAIGTTIGVTGGYFGGRVEKFMVYLTNVKLSLPGILVALSLVSIFGGSFTTLIVVIGFMFWDRFAVVTRTATKQLRNREFVRAAKVVGQSDARIIIREILPNLLDHIIVIASLEVAIAILVESMLSFLGLGIQPPIPSWGVLVAEGRALMFINPTLVVIPGLAIFVLVVAVNLLGDGIRDITSASVNK